MTPEALCFLRALDRRLKEPRRLHLVGEGALVLGYGAERAESCLEVLAGEAPDWALAGSLLQSRYGLCLKSGAATIFSAHWQERCRPLAQKSFRRLSLMIPGREDLLLSKLDPLSDRNREDIAFLARDNIDQLQLIRLFRAMRRQHRGDLRVLDRNFNYVLREHFSLGPFRF